MAIGGLIGLLDDIAALAKLPAASLDDVSAAAGRAKAAGVDGGVARVASVEKGSEAEKQIVGGVIRTDLILSAEIMVIALATAYHQGFWSQLASLVVVAFFITILVYGVVAEVCKQSIKSSPFLEHSPYISPIDVALNNACLTV
ncbi:MULTISPECIES: DUF808 family protein [Halomonadaceae]|uniref:DUF808 family protein n=1 Tax=Halomonadaceae TaxID=28256 RepID=UPI0012F1EC92|nr:MULTISPECIES: DUF808 family protein [Halomonas]CAD5268887.1 hypothetical protein HALOI3_20149 [Halomonas sp. I3]CAD5274812.1 hypothetical protein HALO113_40149 [Halomonas sp. 113]CAD5276409.1 hypothetical protein HALO59_30383 [Halomonas sp. 59]CAD5277179.1 hypothetical protein HALO156_180003 [Halomonas sp. 156]VXB97817.1 hypothetical protein HALO98_40149 [Halomonas titanicae]